MREEERLPAGYFFNEVFHVVGVALRHQELDDFSFELEGLGVSRVLANAVFHSPRLTESGMLGHNAIDKVSVKKFGVLMV